jgi:hypothetical protein
MGEIPMMTRRLYAIPFLLALGVCLLISFPASADVEPNDSLLSPEIIVEGTHSGSVFTNGSFESDVDYYKIVIPAKKDIDVTFTKTDSDIGTLTVKAFDHKRLPNSIFGVWIVVSSPGEKETSSDYNGDGVDRDYYLEISGHGDYEMVIVFTTDTADFQDSIQDVCLITFIVIILIVVFIIGLIIFLIIFFKKRGKKEQESLPGVQVQSNILRSDVVNVQPQQQPQYPPQQQMVRQAVAPATQQPQGMPPQQPQFQPQTPPPQQQMMQQPAAPPVQTPPAAPPRQAPMAPPAAPPAP